MWHHHYHLHQTVINLHNRPLIMTIVEAEVSNLIMQATLLDAGLVID
jgi:hypothetical protein